MEARNVNIYYIPSNKGSKFYNLYLNKTEQLDLASFLNSIINIRELESKEKQQYMTVEKINVISTSSTLKKYDVILTFNNKRNNMDYVVYTDNSYDLYGKLKVFAALYNDDEPVPFIGYPASKEEWEDICELLDKVIIENDTTINI